MAQNPDLLNNEDFEKVDHDPYQDENVTSTSLTGEMAEEDRYEGDSGDLLGDEYTSTAGQPAYQEEPEQLISFDSSPPPVPSAPSAPIPETTVTEPTPPPVPSPRVEPFPEPAAATGGLMAIPAFEAMGAWLENVDPRDDSAKAVEGKDDMMASPDNPDEFEKPGAFSGDLGVDGDIRHFTEADRTLKERENDSDSDSSMSLDGSSGSSDNELSDSDSDSEVSVSDAEENKVEKTKVDFEDRNEAEILGAVGGVDKEILLPGNDGASAGILELGAKDGMNEYILNGNRHSEEDIIAAINEEVNNAYLVEQQQDDIKSKYLLDLSKQVHVGFDFPHFEMDKTQEMENKFESQSCSDVSAMEVCSPVEQEPREIHTDEGAMNPGNNLVSDDNLYPPYFEDGKDDGSGSVQALEKQSENTYEREDALVLSDTTGNTSLYTNPSINIPGLNLHEVSNNDLVAEADTEALCSYDPDMMEKLRLGILKNDSRLSDEIGSDHSSDVERGSNHSGEHHVRFKDEVVVMEYSDEEKEEKEEIKSDAMEKLKDWLASENEYKDSVIEKDSAESIENNENMMLAMGYSDSVVDRSALDLKFYKYGEAEDKSPVENDENFDKTMEHEPIPSFYPVPENVERKAVDEKERTRQLLEIYDNLNVEIENETVKDTEKADLQSESHNDISASSDSDSDEKRSDDESASDDSSDVNVSGEWNLSPLCDMEQNEDAVSGIDAEIPESADANEEESVSSDNICLLNYAPISEDTNKSERSDTVDKEDSVMITNVSDVMEEIEDDSGVVEELAPVNNVSDRNLEYVDLKKERAVHEINSEADVLDIEEQLKEVELTAKLMSEAVETQTEALVSNMEKEAEQINSEETGVETTFDDEAKDYRTEKNQAIVEEAVTLLDNVEKELEHIIEDIDHTPKLKEGSGSLELDINQDRNENDYDTENPGEGLKDAITDQISDVIAENMSRNIIESIVTKDTSKLTENQESSSQVADSDDIQLATQDRRSMVSEDEENTEVELETENLTKDIESVEYNDTTKLSETLGNISQLGEDIQLEAQADTSGVTKDKENTEVELEKENMAKNIENVDYNDTPKVFETRGNLSKVADSEDIQLETQKDLHVNVTEDNDNTKVDLGAKSYKVLSVDNPAGSQPDKVEYSKIKPVVDIHVESLEADTAERISEVGQEHHGDVCETDHTAMNREGDVRAGSRDIVIPSSRVTKLVVKEFKKRHASLEEIEMIGAVVDLIYWRDVKRTGIVFGSMMFVLMALSCFSLISVLAYMSLCVLTVTFTFRMYKSIMQAVQKTNEGHPFKKLMEMNIELKDEVVQEAAENIAKHINNCHRELRRLYLVQDYVDSIKFGMLLWLLTYVGSWFSGMTLIMLVVVSIFTLPRVYETYKVQIDTYINMARAQLNKILAQISAKIPFPKKKAKVQ